LPGKRIAIVQSNYIPWKGYFDLINSVDEFVLLDDVQYTRRDWRNRNRIKTGRGTTWLTIPVNASGHYLSRIRDITISDPGWANDHWSRLRSSYAPAPHFATYCDRIEALYGAVPSDHLSHVNRHFLEAICLWLGIGTRLTWSSDYVLKEGRTARLVSICSQAGAGVYVSGPSARDYIEADAFDRAGITIEYFDYSGYPEYPQLYPPFDHRVSILDVLFSTGPDATRYMLSF
jgi:hypothetical protein